MGTQQWSIFPNESILEKMEAAGRKEHHFVLVHGACHGAWCWYKVATVLKSQGHRVTALDMAAAGSNPNRIEELTSFSDYCQPLTDFMAALPSDSDERVVLVGHSMGGICISLAMEAFPEKIKLAVFATAVMPGPDFPVSVVYAELPRYVDSYMDSKYFFANGVDSPPTSMLFGNDFMASLLYQLSPPEDLMLATLLVRPVGVLSGQSNELTLTKPKYGSVRRVYVVCERDNILKQGFQEWMIQNNPVDEVNTIPGSDHMLMFSKPAELCSCLQNLVSKIW